MTRATHRRLLAHALTLVLLLAGASCPRETAPPEAEEGPPPEVARQRLVALLTQPEETFGPTLAEARQALGPPEEERVEERPNPDDAEQLDRRHHLRWPGLELVFVETPGEEQAWLDRVHATEEFRGWPPGQLFGESEEVVADFLGPPRRAEGDLWLYQDDMIAAYVHAELRFEDGRLAEVVWAAEAD